VKNRKNPDKWLVAPTYSYVYKRIVWRIWQPRMKYPIMQTFSNPGEAHDFIINLVGPAED
jgi:hypothetical protein